MRSAALLADSIKEDMMSDADRRRRVESVEEGRCKETIWEGKGKGKENSHGPHVIYPRALLFPKSIPHISAPHGGDCATIPKNVNKLVLRSSM
jgi:hypothetical protein